MENHKKQKIRERRERRELEHQLRRKKKEENFVQPIREKKIAPKKEYPLFTNWYSDQKKGILYGDLWEGDRYRFVSLKIKHWDPETRIIQVQLESRALSLLLDPSRKDSYFRTGE